MSRCLWCDAESGDADCCSEHCREQFEHACCDFVHKLLAEGIVNAAAVRTGDVSALRRQLVAGLVRRGLDTKRRA